MPVGFRALGIDLAIRDIRDIGAAIVGDDGIHVLDVPGTGRPDTAALATWIRAMACEWQVQVVAIDGPLGWKGPATESPHCRISERSVRAPGKTGLPPDGVKPAAYLGFTRFSIDLFAALTLDAAWRLPGDPRPADAAVGEPVVVTECFPTAIWRGLGVAPLVGKGRATPADVAAACARFGEATGRSLASIPSHDGLQAVVAAYAGWCLARGDERAHLAGIAPFRLDDTWREGYILSVAPPGIS